MTELRTTPSRWGKYGKRPLVALCLVGLVDAVDKGVLPGVLPQLQEDLGINDKQAGLLHTSLVVATLALAVPGGILADRRDRRVLVTAVLGVWSVATALAAAAQSFWQLLTLRAALGAGDAINDPAVQSLVADYYPPEIRGRAYGWQRVVPTVGTALGVIIGGALASVFGWRIAVLAVAVPGIAVTLLVRRLPLPPRGESDLLVAEPVAPPISQADPTPTPADREEPVPVPTWTALTTLMRIRSLRALLIASVLVNGILTALGFWGVSYHVRASGLSEVQATSVAGGLILVGAVAGGIAGGWLTDRYRSRFRGWPLLLAGSVTGLGTILLFASFLDGIPVYSVRLPLQFLGVAFVVAALPPVTVTAAEVVPAPLRGAAFGLLKLFANGLAAIAPPLIGALADARQVVVDGGLEGDLGYAFRWTAPVVLIGSVLLLVGRRHLDSDVAAAREVS